MNPFNYPCSCGDKEIILVKNKRDKTGKAYCKSCGAYRYDISEAQAKRIFKLFEEDEDEKKRRKNISRTAEIAGGRTS